MVLWCFDVDWRATLVFPSVLIFQIFLKKGRSHPRTHPQNPSTANKLKPERKTPIVPEKRAVRFFCFVYMADSVVFFFSLPVWVVVSFFYYGISLKDLERSDYGQSLIFILIIAMFPIVLNIISRIAYRNLWQQ